MESVVDGGAESEVRDSFRFSATEPPPLFSHILSFFVSAVRQVLWGRAKQPACVDRFLMSNTNSTGITRPTEDSLESATMSAFFPAPATTTARCVHVRLRVVMVPISAKLGPTHLCFFVLSVVANTIEDWASCALVIHAFVPSSTHSSPSSRAVVRAAPAAQKKNGTHNRPFQSSFSSSIVHITSLSQGRSAAGPPE